MNERMKKNIEMRNGLNIDITKLNTKIQKGIKI